ncbi:hypothetical protein Taro_046870 [Colocasia esculenta]|uniref:HMA domain-containing protein n=1 Tax=Colocasia esculenta TaxID=4460 RepID=A0A843X6M3_COLES|nr:hypothetical protein [Colocasia esculenta]
MAAHLLRPPQTPSLHGRRSLAAAKFSHEPLPLRRLRPHLLLPRIRTSRSVSGAPHLRLLRAKAVDISAPTEESQLPSQPAGAGTSVLLEVGGMMCGACAARVKTLLSSDERVDSVVVNLLMETAAVRFRAGADGGGRAGEELAGRLTECGFPAKRRSLGAGVGESVRKWKESAARKEELLAQSRNRVAFAWTLVAICCGSHASHFLHSLGIHVAHVFPFSGRWLLGSFWDILHNPFVKCGTAVVSLLNPGLEWEASFFDEPVMLLGFVLLGRSLEERARLKASSDMNELLRSMISADIQIC